MQITILYIGRDPEITVVMDRLLNARPEWKGICVCNDADALGICCGEKIDLVLLGNGIDAKQESALKDQIAGCQPGVRIIQHYGGGSGLLYGEIMTAMGQD